jgi:putative sulfotransferase
MPHAFIVSTGRCGSTLLSEMINRNPDVLSLSEFFGLLFSGPFPAGELTAEQYWSLLSTPHSFVTQAYRIGAPIEEFRYEADPRRRFNAGTGIPPIMVTALPHLTDEPEELYDDVEKFVSTLPTADVATQHRRLFEWLAARFGARMWVERSGFSLRHVPDLVRLFPQARFVHLYRDGRDCAYSMSRSGAFRLGMVSMRLQQALGVNPYVEDVPESVTVPADLVPLMPDTFSRAAFEEIQLPVADFGAAWSEQITTGLTALAAVPADRVMQFSYDRLVGDTAGVLTELAEFLGPVDPSPRWLTEAAGLVAHRPSGWRSLPEAEQQKLTEICREAMALLPG